MNDARFDAFVRSIARAGDQGASRRSLLRGAGAASLTWLLTGATTDSPAVSAQDAAGTPAPLREGVRPPGGPSVAQKAFDLLYDLETSFRFVADEVVYDPYPGALRGPKGTLWGLAGNSVDQALLLAALLNESLIRTRFVVGQLEESAMAALLEAATIDRARAEEHAAAVNRLLTPEEGAPAPQTPTPELQRLLDDLPERGERTREWSQAALRDGVELLTSALSGAGADLPARNLALPERERTQHVWIQYAAGPEWIDLDPTIPGAAIGERFAEPAETLDELPADLFHRVSIRVHGESLQGGALAPFDLITYSGPSTDLTGTTLTFLHARPEALNGLGAAIQGATEGTLQYIPHLLFGETEAVAATDRVTLGAAGGVLDVLGSGSPADGQTVAEWIDVTVEPVDAEPRTATRLVFDRLSIEQRTAGVVDPEQLPDVTLAELDGIKVFLPLEGIWSIAFTGGPVPFSYFQQDRAIDDPVADLAQIGYTYHAVRDALALGIAADRGQRYFVDAPNLTAFSITPLEIQDADARAETTIDILIQSLGSVPFAGNEPSADAPIVAGVLSHVAERAVMEADSTGLGKDALKSWVSVGRLIETAQAEGTTIRTLTQGDDPGRVLQVSTRAALGIAAALEAGYIVVVPESAVRIADQDLTGWWQIDPRTGETFDRMETGRGQTTDYALLISTLARQWLLFSKLGFCIHIVALVGGLVIFELGAIAGGAATGGASGAVGAGALGGAIAGGAIGTALVAC